MVLLAAKGRRNSAEGERSVLGRELSESSPEGAKEPGRIRSLPKGFFCALSWLVHTGPAFPGFRRAAPPLLDWTAGADFLRRFAALVALARRTADLRKTLDPRYGIRKRAERRSASRTAGESASLKTTQTPCYIRVVHRLAL